MAKEYEDEAVTLSDAQELNEFIFRQKCLSSHPVFEVAPQRNAISIQEIGDFIRKLELRISALEEEKNGD